MEFKIKKVTVIEEQNELGSVYIERLIERLLLEELNLPVQYQALVLQEKYKNGRVSNE